MTLDETEEDVQPEKEESWWDLIKRERLVIGIWGGLGLLLLGVSVGIPWALWWPTDPPSWWGWMEGVLVNLGAAALLVVPIELFSSRVRTKVDKAVEATESAVEDVRDVRRADLDAISDTLADLGAFDDAVATELDEKRAADHAVFRAIATPDAGLLDVYRALDRARALGLFSESYGVRVPYSDGGRLHLAFYPMSGTPGVAVILLLDNKQEVTRQIWRAPKSPLQLLSVFDEKVRELGLEERPKPSVIFGGLAETLVIAERFAVARPVIEYFPPQWVVTEQRIIAPERAYGITHNRVDRITMDAHVKGKRWLDWQSFEAAQEAAEALFPFSPKQEEHAKMRAERERREREERRAWEERRGSKPEDRESDQGGAHEGDELDEG